MSGSFAKSWLSYNTCLGSQKSAIHLLTLWKKTWCHTESERLTGPWPWVYNHHMSWYFCDQMRPLVLNKSWKNSELFNYCGSGLQGLSLSNYLQHLDRTKGFQNIGEHTNLREASIEMSALQWHLLSELWVYGPISVDPKDPKVWCLKATWL